MVDDRLALFFKITFSAKRTCVLRNICVNDFIFAGYSLNENR